ncbi:adhesion G protein-coupled receptor F5-like [Embiotoca jacksoni]|uniref:adhesion G protein-coupled receptor F5-like n=1 Tax=Embiotoca jacksoni TaxID=100190 RepID=UPI00370385DB
MAVPKAIGFVVIILVISYNLENQVYRQSLNTFFQELMGMKASPIHVRPKRASASHFNASLNSTEYELQVVIRISDPESLRLILNTLEFPLLINSTGEITSIDITTVCSPNMTRYQCTCEESFAWSFNSCINHEACDDIIGDTCGCINALPADGQYCQPNSSQTAITPTTPSPSPPLDPVIIEIDVDLRVPVSTVPTNFFDIVRDTLRSLTYPIIIIESLNVTDLNFTTGCYPNATQGLQCQCEEQFAWSCDKCSIYGECSNASTQTCSCINGLPSDGQYCEPITSIPLCPTLPPEISTTTPTTMTTTTISTTTTTSPSPPIDPVIIEIDVDLRVPVSTVPTNFFDIVRDTLRSLTYPIIIVESLNVTDLNFTTGCYPNATQGLQCQCEEQFAWSCDKCSIYGECSNASTQTCSCINGLPSDGQFCEPITSIPLCPTLPPEISTTTPTTMTTTTISTTTTTSPSPPIAPVIIEIVVDLRVPVSTVPTNFFDLVRDTLRSLTYPIIIIESLNVTDLNFTTGCYPNATQGLQCQCEEQFAWSCDKCSIYGECSNASTQTCSCINGLPSDGQYCEPITSIPLCPTLPPEISTTTPTTMTTTTISTTTTTSPSPPIDPVIIEIDVDLRVPVSTVPTNFFDIVRDTLRSLTYPIIIVESLNVTDLNFTTGCYPNATQGLQCQCEEQFAWSCDKCSIYGECSNASTQTCSCINGLPSDGQFCEPITSIPLCPTLPPEISTTTPTTMTTTTISTTTTTSPSPPIAPVIIEIVVDLRVPVSTVPTNFFDLVRDALRNLTYPIIISESLNVADLNFTTGCYPNATQGLQCQCEEQFAWSCDKCSIYGECSNASTQTCSCINGLPSDGQFCEPITKISTTTPITITTTMMPNTTTMVPNTTTMMPNTTTMVPNTTTAMPNTTTMVPNTTTAMPNTTTMVPNTTTMMPNTTTMVPNTTTAMPNTTTMVPNTTTAMPNTTTMVPNTTTMMPNTTTMVPNTTTTTIPPTTTTTTPTVSPTTPVTTITPTNVPAEQRTFELIMNIDFQESYNEPTNPVYQDINNAVQSQCQQHISSFISAEVTDLRSGSTIATYNVRATSFEETEIDAVNTGLFKTLSETYPMIFDSVTPLQFNPTEVFFEKSVTVTCGPPPADLNFSASFAAEWTRNGQRIPEDSEHVFSRQDGAATLTVLRFFGSDNGQYECMLRRGDNSIFIQKSDRRFAFKDTPLIQVTPVRRNVRCEDENVELKCSVNSPYTVEFLNLPVAGTDREITYLFPLPDDCTNQERKFTCQSKTNSVFKGEITLRLSTEQFLCDDPEFGRGTIDFEAAAPCQPNKVGEITAVCKANGNFEDRQDNCVLLPVQELLDQSEFLNNNSLPVFLDQLSNVTANFTAEVVDSPATIAAIVRILNNVANASSTLNILISTSSMEDVLETAGILTTEGAQQSWATLNTNDTLSSTSRSNIPQAKSSSSSLLQSLEIITSGLTNGTFDIDTPSILLSKTTFTDTFNADINSSVEIDIPEADGGNKSITVITFASMDNVLPPRDELNSSLDVINGRVVLVQSSGTINNISLTFDIINDSLANPKCVFWNFSLFDGLGGWDDEGCMLVRNINETVTCNCDHLTSFSILMSPFSPNDPVLDFITYIGVGISMASLVICLIIEAVIWRKIRRIPTSYLRHVSIVNIAVSLLIANIWFIIGAAISDAKEENQPACTAATFFIHFFYLALFFWMLASALLLLYRAVSVFGGDLSKSSLLAIGFCLGYGAPLIITIITIAVTAPKGEYVRGTGVCWLNWFDSKALLAFVIPALLIVLINFIILLVVLYKMLRSRVTSDAANAGERNVLVVIARSLAVLTPFFGLTWGLGVGTMTDPNNLGIHYSFAFFNALQGFFILVFGTLLDKKVRSEITIKSKVSSSGTRSTSAGNSSSGLGFIFKRRRARDGYNISGTSGEFPSSTNT